MIPLILIIKYMHNRLDGIFVYLSGPIDHASDDGKGWRQKFIELINNHNIKINIIDPTNKPKICNSENRDFKSYNMQLRAEGKFKELKDIVSQFRHEDLRFVDLSDLIITYIDADIHMCGSYDELFTAERQKKPRMAIIKGGLKKSPLWLFDVFELEDMFESVEECVDKLLKIHNGQHPLDSRWILIRKHFLQG